MTTRPALHLSTLRAGLVVLAALALGACSAGAPPGDDDGGSRPGYVPLGVSTSPTAAPSSEPAPSRSSSPAPIATTAPPSEVAEPSEPAEPQETTTRGPVPQLITFGGADAQFLLVVDQASARSILVGAPRDFQDFAGRVAQEWRADEDCEGGGVIVDVVRTDGFAAGSVSSCGGHAAVWARVDGAWREVAATQEAWSCEPLRTYRVPSSMLLGQQSCLDEDGKRHTYLQD